jgi:hypothetical protein
MKYTLTVTSINNNRAKMIIARQLAHDPAISLQSALIMVEKPPFVLLKNLTAHELQYQSKQLNRLGVKFTITEQKPEKDSQPFHPNSLPENDSQIKETPSVLKEKREQPIIHEGSNKSVLPIRTDTPVKRKKNNYLIFSTAGILLILLLIAAEFITSRNQKHYAIKKKILISSKIAHTSESEKSTESTRKQNKEKRSREKISPKSEHESHLWVDSARACENDYLKAINFYKIAISFNKYNMHAWFGLINTYRNAGMNKEMIQTREQMEEIFGSSVFSVTETVKPFGEILDVYTTASDAFRVEYKTAQNSEQSILNQTYALAKAFREMCNCKTISIFATTAPGKGMIVHFNKEASLSTLAAFKKEASITFLK